MIDVPLIIGRAGVPSELYDRRQRQEAWSSASSTSTEELKRRAEPVQQVDRQLARAFAPARSVGADEVPAPAS
jgi:hypothetical protein